MARSSCAAMLVLLVGALRADPSATRVRVMLETASAVDAAALSDAPARLARLAGCDAPACGVTVAHPSEYVLLAHVRTAEPELMRAVLERLEMRRYATALHVQLAVPPGTGCR